jgi:hypothetical protein
MSSEHDDKLADLAIEDMLDRMDKASRNLRGVGMGLILLTALHLALFFLNIGESRLGLLVPEFMNSKFLLIVQAQTVLGVALLAVSFEVRRRQADVWFEEISDELHWRVRARGVQSQAPETDRESYAPSRPGLRARMTLRDYAKASELPFIPGRLGLLVCASLNLSLLIISAFLPRP